MHSNRLLIVCLLIVTGSVLEKKDMSLTFHHHNCDARLLYQVRDLHRTLETLARPLPFMVHPHTPHTHKVL